MSDVPPPPPPPPPPRPAPSATPSRAASIPPSPSASPRPDPTPPPRPPVPSTPTAAPAPATTRQPIKGDEARRPRRGADTRSTPGEATDATGILGKVFDLSFTTFVTPSIIRILFLIGVVMISLASLGVFYAIARAGGVAVVAAIVITPLFWFAYVLFFRVMCELYLVLFRIEVNTRDER